MAGTVILGVVDLGSAVHAEDGLTKLKYNNPGLVVDLGVGLWAWPVPCDADGDGDYDLIVSCPDKPSNGIWFFENATGSTTKDRFPVFRPAKRISSTVHYVMPSYTANGLRVLTPGKEYRDFTLKGLGDPVALPIAANFYKPEGKQPKGPKVRHNQWRYVDYDGDDALDLVVGIEDWSYYGWDDAWNSNGEWTNGPLHGFVLLFHNNGTTDKPDYADPVRVPAGDGVVDTYGCPSPNFQDFDGDGDLDLLCGEFIDGFTYFRNDGTRRQPQYAAGRKLMLNADQPLTMDLEMIVPVAFDWDCDGDFDLVVGDEDGRVALVENTGQLRADGSPQFLAPRYFQQEADELKCGALATPVGYDWDGDGDTDILSGNTAGYVEFFENLSGPGVEEIRWAAPVRLEVDGRPFRIMAGPNGSIQGPAEAKWGYSTLSVADWNHDGLPDIVTNGIRGRIQWLQNIGTRSEPRLAAPQPVNVRWPRETPKPAWTWWTPEGNSLVTQWRTTPLAFDWTGDGLTDLLVLDQEGYLCLFERAHAGQELILQPPQRVFEGTNFSVTDSRHSIQDAKPGALRLNNKTAGGSGRRKLCITDWNGDGRQDLLVNSTNANLLLQVSAHDGKWLFEDKGPLVTQNIQGHTTSPTVVDFNNDGIPDFLGGAEDGRFYYQRNPRTQEQTASGKE
ncbi:MAG: VCBS repeat-containing protein [Planctomycetaceae bacterium]|nr:VCBS repeat-containing protein [Planctomycetaceae bacterium]